MHLMNIIYVSDMKRSVAFYDSLGLQRTTTDPSMSGGTSSRSATP